ncbi:hypothetical protein BAC3_00086 [uncultured bacterium]|nr:hypothetical protein BAC3_00086 [uncultured bacterium]
MKIKHANTLAGTCPHAETPALEGEIDQLAQRGQLYGLSEDEIKIVEGKDK